MGSEDLCSRETDRTGPKDSETLTDGSGGAWRDFNSFQAIAPLTGQEKGVLF
jgi:hypothetical protein